MEIIIDDLWEVYPNLKRGDTLTLDLRGFTTDKMIAKSFAGMIGLSAQSKTKGSVLLHLLQAFEGEAYSMDAIFRNTLDHEKEVLVKGYTYTVIKKQLLGHLKNSAPIYQIDIAPSEYAGEYL